jgi:hypothetical protein
MIPSTLPPYSHKLLGLFRDVTEGV